MCIKYLLHVRLFSMYCGSGILIISEPNLWNDLDKSNQILLFFVLTYIQTLFIYGCVLIYSLNKHFFVWLCAKRMLSCFSCVCFIGTPWNVTSQAPLSLGLPRKKYWSGCSAFSRWSSWLRDWTCISYVSCIGQRILCH